MYKKYINIILDYWFTGYYYKINVDKWFINGSKYDDEIKEKFSKLLKLAENNKLQNWYDTKEGFIAHTLLLDQFSRHIYRGSANAYKNDKICLSNIDKYLFKYMKRLKPIELLFVLMPYQHTENRIEQERGLFIINCLFKNETRIYAKKIFKEALHHQDAHLKIIEKFGRFPKRNNLLNRKSTNKEKQYINKSKNVPY